MRPRDLRRRESADLLGEARRLEEEIFQRRFHGQSEEKADRGLIRKNRRDVARMRGRTEPAPRQRQPSVAATNITQDRRAAGHASIRLLQDRSCPRPGGPGRRFDIDWEAGRYSTVTLLARLRG